MDLKTLKIQILGGSVARRVLFRAYMLAIALSIISLLQTLSWSDSRVINLVSYHECGGSFMFASSKIFNHRFLKPIWSTSECNNAVRLTSEVVTELLGMKLIDLSAKALCVGEGSAPAVYAFEQLGFADVLGAHRFPFFSLKLKRFVYELDYAENSFDFVLAGDLDKVSLPAILVLQIERILKPGGIGAVLVGVGNSNLVSLIKSATPVSSLLKSSNIVHVGYVHNSTLVVFKKRTNDISFFTQFSLPADCLSVVNNKPFVDFLEPLVEKKTLKFDEVSYLPKFINVASRGRLTYIEIGAGERLNSSNRNWFLPSYPIDNKAFNVYFVDHNTSVLLSCVKKPGITFIYYPGLAGDKTILNHDVDEWDPSVGDEGFDFLAWFKETVQYSDFVILKMKTGKAELKLLADLFKTGALCFVDELFLGCSDLDVEDSPFKGNCMDLFRSLRSSGVFVHQWWRN